MNYMCNSPKHQICKKHLAHFIVYAVGNTTHYDYTTIHFYSLPIANYQNICQPATSIA